MEKLFYYLRDKKNRPVVSVCLIEDGGQVARGMAICSHMDQPCRKTGRSIAAQRAKAAINDRCERLFIMTNRAKAILRECAAPRAIFTTKSFVSDDQKQFSRFERKLLFQARLTRAEG